MTFREKVTQEHPDMIDRYYLGGVCHCPWYYGYEKRRIRAECGGPGDEACTACWDREMPEESPKYVIKTDYISVNERGTNATSHILDSGERREFDTGAVRDIQEGKGRCDLMPLDVLGVCLFNSNSEQSDEVVYHIHRFQQNGSVTELFSAISDFYMNHDGWDDLSTMFLEVSKHFEEGAKKYGENNWQKGIPVHCYIDSAVRHFLKWARGDDDEPHDRAFVWNLMCCIWTCEHMPELNEYATKEDNDE